MKIYRTSDELAYMRGILHIIKPKISAEIGVYEGGSAKIIKEETKELHLFDTFQGILEEQSEENYPAGYYRATLEEAKRNIGEAIYHIGDICKTKNEVKDKLFNFIHIDLDVYIPLKDCLPFFFERLNGVMLVSNYDDKHLGIKRAIYEFKRPFKQYSRFVMYENYN